MMWHFVENGQKIGPVSDEELQQLITAGRITAATLVWNPSLTGWIAYGQVLNTQSAGEDQGHQTCSQCGLLLPAGDMIQYDNQWICSSCKADFFQKIQEGVMTTGNVRYAGFWIRFGAKFLDAIILNVVGLVLGVIAGLLSSISGSSVFESTVGVFSYAVGVFYMVYLHGKYGQTLGKKVCKIKVVRPDMKSITYMRAFGRYFADMLSGMILCIGYIMAGTDDEKRALHDRICDTRVIYVE